MDSTLEIAGAGRRPDVSRLSSLERLLLLLPLLGGAFFGLGPLLLARPLANFFGYPGNDEYVSQLAGAATLGYAVALALGLLQGGWAAMKLLVVATLVFNLASIFACLAEIVAGLAKPVVYLILATSIAITAITIFVLNNHRDAPRGEQNTAPWISALLVIGIVASGTFGLLPLLFPVEAGQFFGFLATDTFLFRHAGAATLGYAVMGVLELRSRRWSELRLATIMATVFNGVSFVVSMLALVSGQTQWSIYLIGVASGGVTVAGLVALQCNGK